MTEPNGILEGAVNAAGAGGGFAGILLAGRWLLNWFGTRVDKRQELLDAQDDRVDREWQKIREAMEARIASLVKEVAALGERVTKAEATNAALTVRVGQQEFVLKLVVTELDRVDPNNAVAKQAKVLLEQVQPSAFSARNKPTRDEAELLKKIDGGLAR